MTSRKAKEMRQRIGLAEQLTGLDELGELGELERLVVDELHASVRRARRADWTWQAIADALGVTRQAAHQRFRERNA
jgi:hypothetical protein